MDGERDGWRWETWVESEGGRGIVMRGKCREKKLRKTERKHKQKVKQSSIEVIERVSCAEGGREVGARGRRFIGE